MIPPSSSPWPASEFALDTREAIVSRETSDDVRARFAGSRDIGLGGRFCLSLVRLEGGPPLSDGGSSGLAFWLSSMTIALLSSEILVLKPLKVIVAGEGEGAGGVVGDV